MMELPESYGLAGQITGELTGKVISEIVILQTPHKFCFFKGNVEDYADILEGQMITGATFQGGMLEIDTEDDIYGNPGKYTTQLSKKSYGEPCTRCGTLIGRAAYMGGTVYFCEHCQKRS